MVPAFGMVILTQNPSTGNGQIPGCSCILSVGTTAGYTEVTQTDGVCVVHERATPKVAYMGQHIECSCVANYKHKHTVLHVLYSF